MFAAEGVCKFEFRFISHAKHLSHIMSHLRFQRVSMVISAEDLRVNEHFNYTKSLLLIPTTHIHRHDDVTLWVKHDKPFNGLGRDASTHPRGLHLHLQL